MSNHLAIATVSAALGHIMHDAAKTAVSGVALHFGRPTAPAAATESKVNLYLYQVTPNAALRNADVPTRSVEGRLTRRPQAALDLHYLMSFYGDDSLFEPDRMLGAVVRDLHARPVLSAAAIQNAINSHQGQLGLSNLRAAVEQVKFTPIQLTLDELSKLWSVMVQTPHALSVAYQGTVVLIEAEESPDATLPVLQRGQDDRGVDTSLGSSPHLDSLWIGSAVAAARRPRPSSLPNAQLGTRLILAGGSLGGEAVRLRLSHAGLPANWLDIPQADRTADEIRFDIPDDAAAQTGGVAGIYGATAFVMRAGSELRSNVLPLVLAPRVTAIAPNPAVRGGADLTVTLRITCRPRVRVDQSAFLLLADREIPAQPVVPPGDVLTFDIDHAPVVSGALLRLRVDGADSLPFLFDEPSGSFIFDDQQRITIR